MFPRYLNEPEAASAFIARSIDGLPVDSETGGKETVEGSIKSIDGSQLLTVVHGFI